MKHTIKITSILLIMFLIAQLIGIYVAHAYLPSTIPVTNTTTGEIYNQTSYNLPYGFDPPEETSPTISVFSIVIAIAIAVALMLLLMRFKAEFFMRLWFAVVVVIGIALALNAFFIDYPWASLTAIIIALPLAYLKIYKRNLIVHNLTELLIYPGIAAVFAPLLNIWSVVILLIIISLYDVYAVWHAGFMQKMAKYQIEKLRVFSGFFIPYIKGKFKKAKKGKGRVKAHVAILGGGDVVFPIILSAVVLRFWGLVPALVISLFATIALGLLFYFSEKGKFYPAMPFISAGCFVGLVIAYFIH